MKIYITKKNKLSGIISIEVEKKDSQYRVIQGNHRLKVLQYLYPPNNILRFKLKRYEANR